MPTTLLLVSKLKQQPPNILSWIASKIFSIKNISAANAILHAAVVFVNKICVLFVNKSIGAAVYFAKLYNSLVFLLAHSLCWRSLLALSAPLLPLFSCGSAAVVKPYLQQACGSANAKMPKNIPVKFVLNYKCRRQICQQKAHK